MYYWFQGAEKHTKRLPESEIRAGLRQLRDTGWLSRERFGDVCPTAKSNGECGFAVLGRIFEALGVAVYSGNTGFKLTNADEATKLSRNDTSVGPTSSGRIRPVPPDGHSEIRRA